MSVISSIEWTDATWNPVRGCTKVSPGCKHCYAKTFAERFRGVPGHAYEHGFDVRLAPDVLTKPLRWTKPKCIFVNSMSDLFHEAVPDDYIVTVAQVMAAANWHTFQVLTKRTERMRKLLNSKLKFAAKLPHIWWGVSVENGRHGIPRIDDLRKADVAVRFLSIEPLLEDLGELDLSGIHWVIVGGESGPGARAMCKPWVEHIRRQCRAAQAPFFFKQWGGVHKKEAGRALNGRTYDAMPKRQVSPLPKRRERVAIVAKYESEIVPRLVDASIQTLQRRIEQAILGQIRPSLVVWDECHWGEHGEAAKIFVACKERRIPVLGLTATPRESSRYDVAYKKTFWHLVNEEYLARPIVEQVVNTGIDWRPKINSSSGDVTRESLQELANIPQRNRVIVEHYVSNAPKFGKTIVFACGIEHANTLARMLLEGYGIAARSIHSDQTREYVARALEDFRIGKIQVIVNVEMLAHGIDVPDAQTVFLCRPTTSDILFSQMVGRAARRDEGTGKTSFKIAEFSDNVLRHGDLFKFARDSFQGAGAISGVAKVSANVKPRRRKHEFDPSGAPSWIPNSSNYPESCHGLWYREGQTFGIEFEITQPGELPHLDVRWTILAEQLRAALAAAMPGRVAAKVIAGYAGQGSIEKDSSVWNVEYDSSAGWEVTTPVLANADGFAEVDAACRVLREVTSQLGLKVDHRAGTHIHLGWKSKNAEELKRAIQLVKHFEPALATLVAPSRIAYFDGNQYKTSAPNRYCSPIASVLSAAKLAAAVSIDDIFNIVEEDGGRYVTFNVASLGILGTVEVRMHSGTLDARKILLWVSLWQQLLWAASHRQQIDNVPDCKVITPDGDIVALAEKYLPDARQPQQKLLLHRLAARRLEVVDTVWRHHPMLRKKWLRFAKTWQELSLTETDIELVQLSEHSGT